MVIPAHLVETNEEPDVVAGHLIAAYLRAEARDPLERLLAEAGPIATLRLLTTGNLADEALRAHAETLIDMPRDAVPGDVMLDGFTHWQVRATPFAEARDMPAETRSALMDGDPFAPAVPPPPPILRDGDWLRLQGICAG
jgi:hypothetical protein